MKNMSHLSLIRVLLLGLLTTGVHPSNPESEIVQDTEEVAISEKSGGTVQKSKPLQIAEEEDYPELAILNFGRSNVGRPRIRVLRPVTTDTGVIWREVEAVYSGMNKVVDRSVLYGVYTRRRTTVAPPRGNNNNNVRRPALAERGDRPPINNGPGVPGGGNRPPTDSGSGVSGDGNRPQIIGGTGTGNRPSINNEPAVPGGSNIPYMNDRPGVPGIGYRPSMNGRPDIPVGGNRPQVNNDPSVPEVGNRPSRPGVPGGGNRPSINDRPGVPGGGNRPFINNRPSVPQGGGSYGYAAAYAPNRNSENQGVKGNANANPVAVQPFPNGQGTATSGANTGRPGGNTSQGGNRRGPPLPATNPNRGISSASPDSNLFSGIINNFAFKLTDSLNLRSNFVFAPTSAFVALALCYMGSEGRTRDQLARALGLDEYSVHGEHLHAGIRDLLISMREDGSKRRLQLLVASGLFYGRNFTAESSFVDQAWRYYRSELHGVDFSNPDLTLSTINQWVSRNTRGAIPTLVDKPPSPMSRLVFLNAVYFKGEWKTQFPPELTISGRFHSSDGTTKLVPMMSLYRETFPFYRSDEHSQTFVKLPYSGDLISMIIALPYTPDQEPFTTSVRDETLCHVLDAMKDKELDRLVIPRFRLEDVNSLQRTLVRMGVRDLFDRQAVNLRRLRRQNDVYVSAILQKALVEVDEQGTTAAAVTGVRFVPLTTRNPTEFVVDRPFAFYVIHEPSGLVLFFGKVTDLGTPGTGDGSGSNDNIRSRVRPRPNVLDFNIPGNRDNNNNDNSDIDDNNGNSGIDNNNNGNNNGNINNDNNNNGNINIDNNNNNNDNNNGNSNNDDNNNNYKK